MSASPRAVPFLPDDHPYFTGYHFPAMARCDADHHRVGWMNHQRSAAVRQSHQGEGADFAPRGFAAQLGGQLPAEVELTLSGIPVAIAAAIPTDRDLGLTQEAHQMTTADDLVQQMQAAEADEQAANAAVEAFGVTDPSADWVPPEYEVARDTAGAAWVRAEEARHALDSHLNPDRYASEGYDGGEAINEYLAKRAADAPAAVPDADRDAT